ncbi:restriction endonuclease subunit S [Pseudomonas aeruginosa]|uniref:restriction endonuclease subunit S n=1 Tax=Pseudomonas aeruginosa TaxID=287 RepID=UPI00157A8CBB|nr:restriction endonuclease subunit S [Pseudomonas aeruginosa]MCS8280423.1 restriction endonuclease subunit S [Pseudomonas aeruginosa]HBO3841588.1 restriction endonuclease subunit S [Pseudomonas aeruginosa]HCF7596865.1 restriction endonuclease subunit S [Pseudomonas aeruginosa]HEH8441955.1 restriction endonuclease subunit S [Pseudomonas aeruginosa]HEH8504577.1 restriction endonuclease subunit S [Pseudomonas aeruginosa]
MSSDWPLKELELIANEVTVGYVGPMASEYVENGVPFLRSLNVEPFRINATEIKYVTPEFHKQIKKSALRPGDVAIVRTGKPGTCAVIPDWLPDANCSDLVIVRCGEKIRPRFLCYWVNSVAAHHISSHTVGAVQQHFNVGAAKKMKVAVPDISTQDAVVEVLGSIDDRITLLRETNATLEAIAQALFKSWFVDFDPVRAKAEGRQPEGMDATTAALFPDSFEDSELGLVPKGWTVRSLDSIADYLNGLALQKFPPLEDAWLPVIKIAQLRKGDTVGADRAGRDIKPEYVIQNGDVLFSWSGSLEVVIWCGGEGALNQHLFKVTSAEFPKWFYYLWTRQHLPAFQHIAASKATTMGHIQRKHLTEAKVVVPSAEVIQMLGAQVEPLLDRWLANAEQAQTLIQLRDTLLPRLISGQLRLPEAQAVLNDMDIAP